MSRYLALTVAALVLVCIGAEVRPEAAPTEPTALIALAHEGVRNRLSRHIALYGWFVIERHFGEEVTATDKDARNHLLHIFFWGNDDGWREDHARWSAAGQIEYRATVGYDGRRYLAYNSALRPGMLREVDYAEPDVAWLLDCTPFEEHKTPSRRFLDREATGAAKERVGGIECIRVDTTQPGGWQESWWIAPDRDYRVVRKRHFRPPAPGTNGGSLEYAVVDRFERVGPTWVPVAARSVLSRIGADNVPHVGIVQRMTALEVHLNEDDGHLPFSVLLVNPVSFTVETPAPEAEILGGDPTMYIERIRQPIDESLTSEDPVEVDG